MSARKLSEEWLHLGLGATAEPQSPFDGMEWYARYAERHETDGAEGRLVSQFRFSANWDVWEMHPEGAEVVICTDGAMSLIQEVDGAEVRTTISRGEYVINPPGVWHTADVAGEVEAIFITAGKDTQHRPR
ncbi:cupin domain-containing protein [Aurantiacibacter sp. D1-12]|uniref:cupin domain-containing protein n=1 Tax=Aurantiacibacter sp. D1-12 TaxID=2993658 RepID=UPI00237CF967|nr:cupin domain-containing protein [Aurantiacibacter sp. D1-12]MDE1467396.1 cupin domain-containing protein [Aurantiacibacter sp. D1-12]